MLHRHINQFVEYCQLADFSVHSIQALDIRLNEFKVFLKSQRIRSVRKINYLHLVDFVADYKNPSIHVRKSRVWTLRQFYHFLVLHRYVPQNIALKSGDMIGRSFPFSLSIQRSASPELQRTVLCAAVDEVYRGFRQGSQRIVSP